MEQIVKRAAGLGATKSEYAALIIQLWFAQGCPPVNETEQRLMMAGPAGGGASA